MLLYERHVKQDNSRHVRYVEDLLAIKIETPLVWSQSELRDLQYPWLQEQIQKQIDHWTSLFERFQQDANCSVNISKEEFFWGLQAVRSRAFSGPYGGTAAICIRRLACNLPFVSSQPCWQIGTCVESLKSKNLQLTDYTIRTMMICRAS